MGEHEIRSNIAATARKYLGVKEGSAAHRELVDRYNAHTPLARGYELQYGDPWCAGFVSAVAIECGVTAVFPTEVGCGKMVELFQSMGRWQEADGFLPQIGDVIFYDWKDSGDGDSTGAPGHVGIVETVSGCVLTVIEGNKDNAVGRREIRVNGRYIRGFGVPDYAALAAEKRYHTLEQTPEYARATIGKLVANGSLRGISGDDLGLSEDLVRTLVILERLGVV